MEASEKKKKRDDVAETAHDLLTRDSLSLFLSPHLCCPFSNQRRNPQQ